MVFVTVDHFERRVEDILRAVNSRADTNTVASWTEHAIQSLQQNQADLRHSITALHATIQTLPTAAEIAQLTAGRLSALLDVNLKSSLQSQQGHTPEAVSRATETLLNQIRALVEQLAPTSTAHRDVITRLDALAAKLPTASTADVLAALTEALKRLGTQDGSGPAQAPTGLPPYQAVHPNQRCRTHGILTFDDVHTRIPMDVRGRPASTSLALHVTLRPNPGCTEVVAALYDAGDLLLSKHVRLAYSLENLPGDALAALHAVCPNFLYKLTDFGAC